MYPRLHPNDPLYVHQWNCPLINMEGAWDRSARAPDPSIVIAVLDTGIAFEAATFWSSRRRRFGSVPSAIRRSDA